MSEMISRINAMERRLEELHARLDETENKTTDHNKQLAVLNIKLDEIRSTLKDLKAFPDNFVSRQEMQARLDATQQQITMLATAVTDSQHNHMDILKGMHSNTIATYGTLITAVIGVIGVVVTLATTFFSGDKASQSPEKPAVMKAK